MADESDHVIEIHMECVQYICNTINYSNEARFAFRPECSSAAATMAEPDPRQVWLGSVPPELTEGELTDLLGRHGIRPYKIVLRSRAGQDHYLCIDM